MDYRAKAAAIPVEDRPIAKKRLSGLGNFFGIYGGEHIAATEFVIGATLVTWGVKATDIFIGLIIGNILATLTYALICAPIAVDTRVTLYSYLRKTLGPYIQKIYNFVWGLASIAMAASMLTVSASAVREIFGIAIQTEWYPTDIKFIMVVVILGIIVTLVAANGFEAVAKFSSVCAPWMIVVFAAGIFVGIPQLLSAIGGSGIHSFSDFMNLLNTSVWNGSVMEGGQKLSVLHVIGFAWMCNLAYHGGLNDMALFRYAKNAKYGFVTSYGMFVGHFFAWGSAGIMGATAAILLNQSLLVLDSGAITSVVLGSTGLLAVIIAGWTTANPNIYRASLAFQTIFGKSVSIKKLTYIIGIVMTIAACFPITANIMVIVNIIVLIVPAVGAIIFTEHWLIPKFGGTRYWSKFKGWKMNYAALIAWGIALAFVALGTVTNFIHSYFLFLPTYFIAMISYLILANLMGARGDYREQEAEERKVQKELEKIVEEEDVEAERVPKYAAAQKAVAGLSYAVLVGLAVLTLMVFFANGVTVELYKAYSFPITLVYFVLGGVATYLKYGITVEKKEVEGIHKKTMPETV